jgi:glycosyltransferase involved in cell wall biosynthesis
MIKVLFLIPNLVGGGAERVFVHLMNRLDRDRFACELALLRRRGVLLEDLAGDIPVHDLETDLAGAFRKIPACVDRVRPDIVIATICYLDMMLGLSRIAGGRRETVYIGRETGMPSLRGRVTSSIWNMRWLYRIAYRRLDSIVVQSAGMREDVGTVYRVPPERMVTIPNPVDTAMVRSRARDGAAEGFDTGRTNIVTAGHLNRIKGYDMLLRAFARTSDGLHLHILGDGELGGELERLAADLGIDGRVTFHGFRVNPFPFLLAADGYVMSSWYEGFPNAVAEALALGCPVVAFDSPGGIRELVEDGVNGELVPFGDEAGLAAALDRSRGRSYDRDAIAARIAARLDVSVVTGRYEALFEELARGQGRGTR